MIVVPVPVPPGGPAPDRGDRATFNARAVALVNYWRDQMVPGLNALADATNKNAQDTYDNTVLALGYRNVAQAAATTATTAAGNASTSETNATAAATQASKLNLGAKAVPPTTDNQGQPLLKGALYVDTSVTPNVWRAWNGTQWVAPVQVTSGLSSVNGKTGPDVVLVPSDIAALPSTGAIAVNGSVRAPRVAVAALAIDCSLGNYFSKTVNGNSTFTFSGAPAAGSDYGMSIDIVHTSGVITWPTSVKWPGDSAPSLTTGKVHKFFFTTSDGGVTWRGAVLSNYAS